MDFRIAAPHRDSAEDAVAGTGARTDEAAGLTYAELMPKLMKSSVPLAILVGLRYLLEYSVPILLYLGWLMIYNNLAYDFAGHLVFKSGLETYSLIRELLRSLLLLSMVCLVVNSNDFISSGVLRVLYFCKYSDARLTYTLSFSLFTALAVDLIARTIELTIKIGMNIVIPFCRTRISLFSLKKYCFRRKANSHNGHCDDAAVRIDLSSNSTLRRRVDWSAFEAGNLEEGRPATANAPSDAEGEGRSFESVRQSENLDLAAFPEFLYLKRFNILYDSVFTLYRHAIPIPIWLQYFSQGPYALLFCISYVMIKMINMIPRARAGFRAAINFYFQNFEYGTLATEQELSDLSCLTCPICYDTFQRPMALSCHHIFCEHCIVEWFQRESSCPICRESFNNSDWTPALQSVSVVPVLM